MFTLKFALKNIVSRKSSLVIILFIAFSIAALVMANAVFDGTRSGIEKTFSQNFTGDIVIRPKAQFPMSLFGDETPITGNLSELPQLVPYSEIYSYIMDSNFVKAAAPQITGQAALRFDDKNFGAYFFGVDAQNYVRLMPGIKILQGEPYGEADNSMMMSVGMLKAIYEECGILLKVGDQVQLAGFTGASYTLRAATLSAVYDYSVHNDLQDKIILINPDILRPLIGLNSTEIDPRLFTSENSGLLKDLEEDGIDSLFGDDAGFEDASLEGEELFAQEDTQAQEAAARLDEPAGQMTQETVWNYIVCSTKPGVSAKWAIRKLNKEFAKREWPCQAVDWRAAAGMAAQYIYWMRLIFNIGLIVIIATGFIIVNNTLVIAALDRSKETGALRAIGAGRRFVALEYLAETLTLTITAGILGCILGVIGNLFLSNGSIHFGNTYLIQLFGGDTLRTVVRPSNILSGMLLSFILAIVAWLYPVRIALGTSPVAAMEAVR